LRRTAGTVVIALLLAVALPAAGDEYAACWRETVTDPLTNRQIQITRCRLAGGAIADYASDTSVPVPLSPAAGTDLLGDCWFLTSLSSNWVYLNLFVNGDAVLGWDPDPATPGGIAYATNRIPRCTSEPNPAVDPFAAVWDYVTAYIHPPPAPDLNPRTGEGVTGLATFVGVPVPDDHSATLSAGGVVLEVEIVVDAVIIDWGDGLAPDTYPADSEALAGFPDGIAIHTYEIKREAGYTVDVAYDWSARWRVSAGVWNPIDVPNTSTTVIYPVAEIISVLTP
jgi:hypothetical protein